MKISAFPLTLVRTTDACSKLVIAFFKCNCNGTNVEDLSIDRITMFVVYVGLAC